MKLSVWSFNTFSPKHSILASYTLPQFKSKPTPLKMIIRVDIQRHICYIRRNYIRLWIYWTVPKYYHNRINLSSDISNSWVVMTWIFLSQRGTITKISKHYQRLKTNLIEYALVAYFQVQRSSTTLFTLKR